MNPRRALLIVVVLGTAAVLWAAARYPRAVRSANPTAAAEPAAPSDGAMALRFFKNPATVADFTVTDLDGRTISASSLRGKVTLINFWATWCGPCRAEIPDLVALQEKYRDQLQIIGISEDEVAPEVVKKFAAQLNVNYPIVMVTPELEKKFGNIVALPTSFVLDREARIVQKHVGMLTRATTEAETRALAGLTVDASIEHVDQTQGLKLDNSAQATTIPGVDLAKLSTERRTEALQKLNAEPCTCGCDLTVARCRVDDPSCGISLPLARKIVQRVIDGK
jgi:thiol-disulfide isomerase/thioredoxin